ncbi:hypothetical protein [Endozoicomonas sp. 8E]|uniref:hypothetical protein n=1 Tax=Endozoicomonas sp. 8E TaxID=3035692 RepID=UPI0029391AC0|nr:hypothetical protein [Endozoicomonas sp. 8E]WOG28739.1 hypothetical protein P6910_03525 [Endozoicomonas sp. 8E]
MSTRSRIARRLADGRYCSIYCHFDGDLVGNVLQEHYPTEDDAEFIMKRGDMSCITKDSFDAYRDRGEPWSKIRPRNSDDLQGLIALAWETGAEYIHYWQDGCWQTISMWGPQS